MSNFKFLRKTDRNLFQIINEAEKLYRDEYFEQCMTQARRFAENLCRNILGAKAQSTDSFDEMLSTLKDKPNLNPREREFLDDLYFIKKAGNASVHGSSVNKDAITALECLQRAFEAAISYSLLKHGFDEEVDALQFDDELLVLGTKSKKTSLKEKYVKEKQKEAKVPKPPKQKQFTPNSPKSKMPDKNKVKVKPTPKVKIKIKKNKSKNKGKGFLKHLVETLIAAGIVGAVVAYFL